MGEGGRGGSESQTPESDEVEEEAAEALMPDELPDDGKEMEKQIYKKEKQIKK